MLESPAITDMPVTEECDVAVIGGGPAGSTAAALLAERGVDVVLLEKEQHPRFHIGESLLPRNMRIFQRLGVAQDVERIGVYKPGAEFASDACGRSMAYPFSLALRKDFIHSYQVRRDQLDQLLFENAAARGARTAQRALVTQAEIGRAGERSRLTVVQDGKTRILAPRFVLDASGRDTLLASKLKIKKTDKNNTTAAVFAHFRNVQLHRQETEGYITIHLVKDGWCWAIPLPDGITSIGIVGSKSMFKDRKGSLDDLFMQRIRESRTLGPRMVGAELASEIRSAGNYSYRADKAWGENFHMIGDAFAFLDPLFSSGVLLAMTSGELGADVAMAWLKGRKHGMAASRAAEKAMRREMDSIRWLIYRISSPVLRSMFMTPSNKFRMRDGLISILSGDLRGSARAWLPVTSFKTVYYMLSLMHRMGMPIEPPKSWGDASQPMAAE